MRQLPEICDGYPLSTEFPCDDEIEAAEDWFGRRITAAECDDWLTEPDDSDWRNSGAVGELYQRWWRRPSLCGDLADDPFRALSLPEIGGCDVVPSLPPDDVPPTWATVGDTRPTTRTEQLATLQIIRHRLSLRSAEIRLFDPIPASSLAPLPPTVAEDILGVLRRCDRARVPGVRPILQVLRSLCAPLGEFEIVTVSVKQYMQRPRREFVDRPEGVKTPTRYRDQSIHCTDMNLKYDGREFCLLRYERVVDVQDVSDQSARAIGCSFTLLSEHDEALAAEIERFNSRELHSIGWGALDPSVRRFTQTNPFHSAPEDGRSLEDCFCSDEPDSEDEGAAEESSSDEELDSAGWPDGPRQRCVNDKEASPPRRRRASSPIPDGSRRRSLQRAGVITRR